MRCPRPLPLACLLGLLGSFLPSALLAQVHLRGTVVDDSTGAPVSGVVVEILDDRRQRLDRSVTGPDGAFRFLLPEHGGYRFRASRIGYARTVTPVLWTEGHDTVQVEVRIHPQAVLLAPLEVTAWSRRSGPSPVLTGFYDRLQSGLGHFFTREDIERRRPTYVSDLIATVPGVHLRSSGRGTRRLIYMSRSVGNPAGCVAQIYVDGFLLNRRSWGAADFAIDDAVAPGAVEAIEVYRGLSTVPAQFLSPDADCGVVVVWTRRGG